MVWDRLARKVVRLSFLIRLFPQEVFWGVESVEHVLG